jgi:hypothetical protein
MNAEKTKISGTWSQGQPLPLVFERTSEAGKPESASGYAETRELPVRRSAGSGCSLCAGPSRWWRQDSPLLRIAHHEHIVSL